MEDPGDTQYFVEGAIPDSAPLDYDEKFYNDEGNEYFAEI